MTRIGWVRRLGDARVALGAFVAVQLVAIPLLLVWGHKRWFWADDWDFLAGRTGGRASDLFRPHYEHWTTVPILAYRALWWVFGIRTYVPYQLLVILLHLAAAALLRVVMRRAGVRPWIATLTAGVFVFFGAGAENILVAFQITFVGSLVFGLGQLLLADHDGPVSGRDWLALGSGFLGLMCSGVAIAMTLVVAIAMLLRRGWRIALLQTAPLAVAYTIWSQFSPKELGGARYKSQTPFQVAKFVGIGVGSIFGRITQVPGLSLLLVLLTIVGLWCAVRARGVPVLRSAYALPLALLLGAGLFLLLTGVARAGQPTLFAAQRNVGPRRARESRYVYITVAMALPAVAIAADAISRRWRVMTVPVVVLLLAGLPGNIHDLRVYTNDGAIAMARTRTQILIAPRVPLAKQIGGFEVTPAHFRGLTLHWLVASLPSGRIPGPGPVTPKALATETLALGVVRSHFLNHKPCRPLDQPEVHALHRYQSVTMGRGAGFIRYISPDGVASARVPFNQHTSIVGASRTPIDIQIEPALAGTQICV